MENQEQPSKRISEEMKETLTMTPEKSTGHVPGGFSTPEMDMDVEDSEEGEEEDLTTEEFRKKHPDLVTAPNIVLHRKMRLERGHKYFDSGDYNMARAKTKKQAGMTASPKLREELLDVTGEDHPTPDTIPHKKYPPAPGVSKLAL